MKSRDISTAVISDKAFYKRLIFLALPIIGQDMLNSLVNILDTFMIGSMGAVSITAVGLSNQFFFVFIISIFGISSGTAILMGQFYGSRDIKNIRKSLGLGVILSLITAVFFAYSAIIHPGTIMRIYSQDETVIAEGISYLKIIAPSYLICAVIVPVNAALKSMNQPKVPMITTAIALIVNLTLNYLFIFVLKLGVRGAAMATLIARSVELIVQICIIIFAKMPLAGKLADFLSADKSFFRKYIGLTAPVIINEFIWVIGTSLYNVAYKFLGTPSQAAVQITSTITNLFWVVGMGIGSAAGIILANELGAKNRERAIIYSRKIIKLAAIISLLLSGLLLLFAPAIVNVFNVTQDIKTLAYRTIYITASTLIIRQLNFTIIVGILRSGGDTLFCMIIDLIAVWTLGVPLAFFGAYYLGLPIYWVLLMINAEELLKLVLCLPRTLKNSWAKTLV